MALCKLTEKSTLVICSKGEGIIMTGILVENNFQLLEEQ